MGSGRLQQSQSSWKYEGPFAPVVVSILGIIAWALFILLFALYWSSRFNLFQDVIVTIVSLIIIGLLIGLMWIFWLHMSGRQR
jgi:hypothetical protein